MVKKPVPQSAVVFAAAGLKRNDPDFYAAEVMNYVLGGGGLTSRLYNEVREKRGLAYSINTSLQPLESAGLIRGGGGTVNASVAEMVRLIRAEWRRLGENGVSAGELADAKTYLTGSFTLRFSSSGRVAAILVSMRLDALGIDFLDRRNALVEAVTLAQVNQVARRLIDAKTPTFVVVGEPVGSLEGQ